MVDPGSRVMAQVVTITSLTPIPGYDRVELASFDVHTWRVVVEKNKYAVGERVLYFAVDAVLAASPDVAFLGDDRRIKARTVAKTKSEGLVGPLAWLLYFRPDLELDTLVSGTNVTEWMYVLKHVPQLERPLYDDERTPSCFLKPPRIPFPSIIPKTDEPRIQQQVGELAAFLQGHDVADVTITTKMDGTSCTFFTTGDFKNRFHVCSRNFVLDGTDPNDKLYLSVMKDNDIALRLERCLIWDRAFQAEICGPGINGNSAHLARKELLVFNVFDMDARVYLDMSIVTHLATKIGLQTVPHVFEGDLLEWLSAQNHTTQRLPMDRNNTRQIIEALLEVANTHTNPDGSLAEGLVIKSASAYEKGTPRFSCKVLSKAYDDAKKQHFRT